MTVTVLNQAGLNQAGLNQAGLSHAGLSHAGPCADNQAGSQADSLSGTVMEGHDGFLFHRDHEAVEQLTGALRLNEAELANWVTLTEARAAWCRARNIAFRFLIVPEKHVVYADRIPWLPIAPDRPALQILNALGAATRAETLYPLDLLRDSRASFETYFVTDTHWTERAAFAVTEQLLASLPPGLIERPVTAGQLGLRTRPYIGDLGVRLEPEREEVATTLFHDPPRAFSLAFHNKGKSRGSTIAYRGDPAGRRLLAFRDSFFNTIIPHIIPVLSRTVAVSSINMHYDLIEAEKPDIIVFEIAERFLGNLDGLGRRIAPDDDPATDFESFSGVALADLAAS